MKTPTKGVSMKPEPLKERYCDLTLAEKVCVLAEFS